MAKQPSSYALLGFVLGWGAPMGALCVRYGFEHSGEISRWVEHEIQTHFLMYLYMAVSTAVVFSVFAAWMGARVYQLRRSAFVQQQASDVLNELSLTDGLTGLFNHRYLQERLQIETERAQRYETPLAVLMIDIDDFKRLNDHFGHTYGDQALRHVAGILMDSVRKIDVAGRYGGEEFLVILPQTGMVTAFDVAERIRKSVAESSARDENDGAAAFTVTIGLASWPHPDIKSKAALLQAADKAMYDGKGKGKNRVEIHGGASLLESI